MNSLNVRTILIITASLSTLSVARQNVRTQLFVLVITLILLFGQRSGKKVYQRILGRLRHLIPVLLSIIVLQILFRRDGNEIFSFFFLKVTDSGLFNALTVGLRLINLIFIAGILFRISSSDYLIAFKAWKIPYEISFLVTTVIRFIPDYYRLFLAYKEELYLRNIDLKKLPLKNRIDALITLLIPVLINNLSEVKFRAIALDLKAFRLYRQRTALYEKKLLYRDYLIQLITIIALLFALLS